MFSFPKINKRRKIIIFIIIAALVILLYYIYKGFTGSAGSVSYMTSQAERGAISVSVSGIGQVLPVQEEDIKSKASGELTLLDIAKGQQITKGTLIAKIDDISALRDIRDAESSLESAQLSLQQLIEPPDALEIERAENEITKAKSSLSQLTFDYEKNRKDILKETEELENDLPVKFTEAFNNIADVFIDLPSVMSDITTIIEGRSYDSGQVNLVYYSNKLQNPSEIRAQKQIVEDSYENTQTVYDEALDIYQQTSRSDTEQLENLTEQVYEAMSEISDTLKELNIYLTLVYDENVKQGLSLPSLLNSHINMVSSAMSTVNPNLSTLFNDIEEIDDIRESIKENESDLEDLEAQYKLDKADQELTIREKENSLEELKAGADELDIKEKRLQVQQKQDSLNDLRQDLSDYYVYMPFDGVISSADASQGDLVSSSTVLATAISDTKMAEITLNEIDVVKVAVGQRVVLTFDSIDDFSLSGEVSEIDTVGTVDQGIVNYDVRVSFDIDDDRIKPGMSVSTTIISESKQDTLLVPNSAVKTQNGASYVEVLESGKPVTKPVETGISNDTTTEILSGIEEGDDVITSTVTVQGGNSSSSSTTSSSGRGGPSGGMMPPMF